MGVVVLDRQGRLVDTDVEVQALMRRAPELERALADAARSQAHQPGWSEHAARLPAGRTLRIRMLVDASPGDVIAFVAEEERPHVLDPVALSPREREVTRLIGSGATDAQVGRRLKIAVATVRWHLTNIYRKTGLPGRSGLQAAARASRPLASRLAAARR